MLFIRYYLWIVPHVLMGLVLVASLKRRLHKQLPIFCVFAAFEMLQFVVLFAVSKLVTGSSLHVYLWFLTGTAAIEAPLKLAVIYELARNLIFSRTSLRRTLQPVFTGALAGLVILAAVASGSLRDITRQKIGNGFGILDFSSGLVEVGILVSLFLFSRALRVSWWSRLTGVALGFGISACINLATAALRSGLGESAFIAVDITQMAALHLSVVVWLIYLFLPDRTPASLPRTFNESEIQFWDQQLQRMTGQ